LLSALIGERREKKEERRKKKEERKKERKKTNKQKAKANKNLRLKQGKIQNRHYYFV
jgi:hypothetical protein